MKHILFLSAMMFSAAAFAQNNNDWPNFKKYAVQNEQPGMNTAKKKRVVFMGDSITEFWKSNDSAFFHDNNYVDRGISGQTTSQMLLRFRDDVIALKPHTVVILAGINDIAENTGPITLEHIAGNIISMCELARAHKIKVVLCSVLPANTFPWRKEILPAEKVIQLNVLLRSYAAENKIPYVDYYTAMVDDQKGLGTNYSGDGVHPNLAGYKVMENVLQPYLK